jgi:hypothetical protein
VNFSRASGIEFCSRQRKRSWMTARHRCSAQNEKKGSDTKRRQSQLSYTRREWNVKSSVFCSWWASESHQGVHVSSPRTRAITKPRDNWMRRRPLHHACKNSNYVCKMWYRMNLPGPGGVRRSMCAAVGQAELSRPECQLYGNRRRRPDPEAKGRTPI